MSHSNVEAELGLSCLQALVQPPTAHESEESGGTLGRGVGI